MKQIKKQLIYALSVTLLFLVSYAPLFSQEEGEGDANLRAWIWYYGQRSYPNDSIPAGAFQHALTQREAIRQSNGYQFPAPLHWNPIGPRPLEWVGGVYCSGRIVDVKYDPRDAQGRTIYVTGLAGGLWKTTDAGDTWEKRSGDLPDLSAGAFALDPAPGRNILYFGCGDVSIYFGTGRADRLFKSTDDGSTWISISNGLVPGTSIYKIAIHPVNPDIMFVATFHGLYKTTDGGLSWRKPTSITDAGVCSDVCFSPIDGNIVYAVGPSTTYFQPPFSGIGFWRSDDGGNIFSQNYSGYPYRPAAKILKTKCSVSKADPNLVWLIDADDENGSVHAYKSINGGRDFVNYHSGENGEWNTAVKYHLFIKCSDINPNICFIGWEVIYRTINAGQNWSNATTQHTDNLGFDFDPVDDNTVTAGCDGGVFTSNSLGNPGTWNTKNEFLGSLGLMWQVASDVYDKDVIVAGMHDYAYAYKYPAGGDQYWRTTNEQYRDGGAMVVSPFKSKAFVGAKVIGQSNTEGQPIQHSSDGMNFTTAGGYTTTTWTVELTPFTFHPSQPGTIYTARFDHWNDPQNVYIYKSTDNGAYWGGGTGMRTFVRPSSWSGSTAPVEISISQHNPEVMIMNFGNGNEWWHFNNNSKSKLIKSSNGGLNWFNEYLNEPITEIVTGGSNGTPDRFFSHVEFDPKDENILYLTVSGYYYPGQNEGHVFKSIDGGYNWLPMNGNLPDIPVSDLIVHYTGTDSKELIIATDAGIYRTDESNINWSEISTQFPNTFANHLDYSRLSGSLRVSTWGRGTWEFQLDQGPIYVQDHLFITDNTVIDKPIIVCNNGTLTLGHPDANPSVTLNFTGNGKIIAQSGGHIDATSGIPITLQGNSSSWGGIEFDGTGYGTLTNCTFSNTQTPVTINGSGSSFGPGSSSIVLNGCTFNSGSVSSTSRDNVTVQNCVFSGSSASTYTCLSVTYGNNITIANNNFHNSPIGISVSNCSPALIKNTIDNGDPSNAYFGISMNNSYSSTLSQNTVNGYRNGIFLFYCESVMFKNNSVNNNPVWPDTINGAALYAEYISNPRLVPTPGDAPGQVIWDAGQNNLQSTAGGNGIFIWNLSQPRLDYGNNTIVGAPYDIEGWIGPPWDGGPIGEYTYYARSNCWGSDGFMENVIDATFVIDPAMPCTPGGGGENGTEPVTGNEKPNEEMDVPPQPIIINYGHGIYDTIQVTNQTMTLPAHLMLYSEGVNSERAGDYTSAINYFKQVMQSYPDSSISRSASKKVLHCYDKANSTSQQYADLRTYYQGVIQNHLTDTPLVKTLTELSTKCLVRQGSFSNAISEYENVVNSSSDSLQVLCSELNIVETYMIMQQGGLSRYTGQITRLKPQNTIDGLKMINQLLHHIGSKSNVKQIPTSFSLSQNYPNPFNPSTKIKFALPSAEKVTLKIYDILGRVVKTLVNNEFKDAGYYEILFDATNLASGVYFYRIEMGKFVQSKKMVVLK